MSPYSPTLMELGLAYRRTKTDLFFSTRHCNEDLFAYEKDLAQNLVALADKIEARAPFTFSENSWDVIPTGFSKEPDSSTPVCEPWEAWEQSTKNPDEKLGVDFRVMEDDLRIRRALKVAPNIDFYRYQISFTLLKQD